MDEYVTQRALLVKDGMCSYEEKWKNAMFINEIYEAYRKRVDPTTEWLQKGYMGTNLVRYIILYGDNNNNNNNNESSSTFHNATIKSQSQFSQLLPMKFLSISPTAGEKLTKLLVSRYRSTGLLLMNDPYLIGRKILIDSVHRHNATNDVFNDDNVSKVDNE